MSFAIFRRNDHSLVLQNISKSSRLPSLWRFSREGNPLPLSDLHWGRKVGIPTWGSATVLLVFQPWSTAQQSSSAQFHPRARNSYHWLRFSDDCWELFFKEQNLVPGAAILIWNGYSLDMRLVEPSQEILISFQGGELLSYLFSFYLFIFNFYYF